MNTNSPTNTTTMTPLTPEEFKRRKKELIEVFSDVVKIKVFALLTERGYELSSQNLQDYTKEIMMIVIRQVSVEGEPWHAAKVSSQIDEIVDTYINKLLNKHESSLSNTDQQTSTDIESLDQIILQVRSKERDAEEGYQIVFERLNKYISRLLRQKLGTIDKETLKDLTSMTLIAIWANIDNWDPNKGKFTTWASAITRNKAVDYIRRYEKEGKYHVNDALTEVVDLRTPEEAYLLEMSPEQLQTILLQALMKFNDQERTILLSKIAYDISFEDLAEILQGAGYNLTAKSVEYKYRRTREKLRHILQEEFDLENHSISV